MSRRAALAAVLILAGCAGAPKRPDILAEKIAGPRRRVAVVDFENKTAYGQRLGTAAADILVTELARTDRFTLIERAKLDKLMAEQKLGLTGIVDPATAAQMGKVLGAAAIVTGAVSQFGVKAEGSDYLVTESKRQIATAAVDVRIVDVETAQILYAETGKGEARTSSRTVFGMGSSKGYDESLEGDALRAAIQSLSGNLVGRLQTLVWSCRVAQVDGRTLYLDAGQRTGLELGTVLRVIRLGEEIKSPATGVVIGRKETEVGRAKVTEYFSDDGAKAEVVDGAIPSTGDLCRIPVR